MTLQVQLEKGLGTMEGRKRKKDKKTCHHHLTAGLAFLLIFLPLAPSKTMKKASTRHLCCVGNNAKCTLCSRKSPASRWEIASAKKSPIICASKFPVFCGTRQVVFYLEALGWCLSQIAPTLSGVKTRKGYRLYRLE